MVRALRSPRPFCFKINATIRVHTLPHRCASGVLREGRWFERFAVRAHFGLRIIYPSGFTSCPLRCASGVLREGRWFEHYAVRAHFVLRIMHTSGFTSCPLRCASGVLREGRGLESLCFLIGFAFRFIFLNKKPAPVYRGQACFINSNRFTATFDGCEGGCRLYSPGYRGIGLLPASSLPAAPGERA